MGIYGDEAVVNATTNSADAWLWSGGSFMELPSDLGAAERISDNGLILGSPSSFEYAIYDINGGKLNTYTLPFSGNTVVYETGINASGTVSFNTYVAGKNSIVTLFLQATNGNDIQIDMGENGPYATGVSDNDTVTLNQHFLHFGKILIYQNGELSPLKVPKAQGAKTFGISGAGVAFGFAGKRNNPGAFGFTYDGTNVTTYNVPGSVGTVVTGVSPAGVAVGYYYTDNTQHGFIYSKKKYITIDYPGSTSTRLSGMSSTGSIIGVYTPTQQANPIPFIGVCSNPKGCTE